MDTENNNHACIGLRTKFIHEGIKWSRKTQIACLRRMSIIQERMGDLGNVKCLVYVKTIGGVFLVPGNCIV